MYKPGQWNWICDVCGFQFKSAEMKERWDGVLVCAKDYEPRHPADFARSVTDDTSIPWSRPQQTDTFIDVDYIE